MICCIGYRNLLEGSLALYIGTDYGVIQLFQLRLSPSKAEKSNTSARSLLGVTIKNTQTEQNLVWGDTFIAAIYIHKKATSNFKLSGTPVNGNVFGNKTSVSR